MNRKKHQPLKWVLILLLCVILAALGWYWYDNNVDRSGWVEDDSGAIYYRDFHAKKVTGWQEIDGIQYYFGEDKAMVTGWQDIAGEVYFFGQDGHMATGWRDINEQRYYFDESGAQVTGWADIDGSRYYLYDAMQTGWLELEGAHYYLDGDGKLVTGWQDLEDGRYHFGEDGTMTTGWLVIDDTSYYLSEDGHPYVGSITLGGENFLFSEDGTMFTGWAETDYGTSYYHPNGVQAFGWTDIDEKRYYFDDGGNMVTGWLQLGEYKYYLQSDGSAAIGPTVIDGQTYYFTPKGIQVVLVNYANYVPSYYKVNLVTITGWHQVSDVCLEPLKQMLADCNAAGIEYTFNSAHRTIEEQTTILEYRTKEHMADFDLSFEDARKKALETVAIPGTSEHHLGLAVDLLGEEAIAWFTEHCWDYGFIVRYTGDKAHITGIIDEPWHFRYVGTEVSLDMKDSGLCLEEYLGAA